MKFDFALSMDLRIVGLTSPPKFIPRRVNVCRGLFVDFVSRATAAPTRTCV